MLARLLGIPSRVAIGYTGGSAGPHGVWQVTTADAHAWPELYFPGEGWLRFEPTPAGGHGQGTATVPTYARGTVRNRRLAASNEPRPSPIQHRGRIAGRQEVDDRQPPHAPAGNRAAARWAGSHAPASGWPSASRSWPFLLIAWPALTRLITRRRRWLAASGDAGHAARCMAGTDRRPGRLRACGCPPGETPRGVGRRLAREASLASQRCRPSPGSPQPRSGPGTLGWRCRAPGSLPTCGPFAGRSQPRCPRAAAACQAAAASTLAAAARLLLERAGGLFSWLDTSWPALRQAASARTGCLRRPAPG